MESKAYFEIQSSNRLSANVVKRLTAKRLININGVEVSGATKYMIAAMIHFSHICNLSGDIYGFKTSDLELVLRCNKRSTFNVIRDLVNKGFISVEGEHWTGIKNIHLIDNDFSTYNKGVRYLNTNRDFFNYRNSDDYDSFLDLSLFAMRTFLSLLLNYNEEHGYHISYDTLCSQIKVKKRALISNYLLEIKTVLKDDFCVSKENREKRIKFGSISIEKGLSYFKPKSKVDPHQDTYYGYKWYSYLRKLDTELFTDVGTWKAQAGRICAIVHTFLEKHLKLETIERMICQELELFGLVNEAFLFSLYGRLNNLTF